MIALLAKARVLLKLLPVLLLIVGLVTGYVYGRHTLAKKYEQEKQEQINEALTEQGKRFGESYKSITEHYEAQLQQRDQQTVITKKVVEYVQSPAAGGECFNNDELQLATEILTN